MTELKVLRSVRGQARLGGIATRLLHIIELFDVTTSTDNDDDVNHLNGGGAIGYILSNSE
jgi:hypothetical protein